MNHGDRVTIACKPNSDHHHPEIREKRAAMNGKTGEVVTIATLSGDVLVEADGVRSWFWASELTPAPSVEADLRATIAGLRDELANEKAAHAECERLLSEERSVRAVAVRARIEAERREDEARETIDLVVRGIPEEYRGYSRPHLCIAAMLGEFDGERRAHDKTKRLLVAAVELGRAATDVVGAWDFVASLDEPIARLRTALDAFEAPPTTAPLAQALGLLRRTRAVLHKLDPAHELLRAEIDALLAGAPVVESRRPTEDVKATLLSAVRTAHDGEQGRRDHLGRIVREEWIKWAREQPSPKPSWLVPWEGLSEPDKEVDRRIGARLYSIGVLSTAGEPQIAPTAYHPEIEAAIDGVVSATKGVGPSPFERAVVRLLGMLSKHREGLRAPLTEEEARRLAREIGDLCHNPDVNELDTWTRTLLAVDRGETPPEVRPVAPFTEDDARHSLGAALREAAKRSAPVAPPTPDLDTRPSFVQSMRDAGYKPLPSPLRIVCREFDDLHECALDINHEGDHNTAADGSGDSFPNFAPDLAALCARRDRLRARFASYNGGDRPMSPPVALIRELAEVEAQIEAAKDATPDAPHTHPLSPEDEARGFVPAWTADKPHTMAAPSKRPKTHALKARLAGVTCPSCGAPLALCECPTNRG